ncbi:hypothetical protein EVAR_69281_1 [Eumeta japonica]|uniref:Uncharacterized protein n=1 Tax=Eumeta variegata TaxID=151549 RepID=A0A4C1ST25_EUMVA|nr:hypothetical protein EVAR_69281_1 [Eumeta japonica]
MKERQTIHQQVTDQEEEDEEGFGIADEGVSNEISNEYENSANEDPQEDIAVQNDDVNIPARGRGRPRIIRDGKRGRPKKQFNMISGLSGKN